MPPIVDRLTPEESDQINWHFPVLGKNPPGIDLAAVLERFRDNIDAGLGAGAPAAVLLDGADAPVVITNITFADSGLGFVVPEAQAGTMVILAWVNGHRDSEDDTVSIYAQATRNGGKNP